MAVKLKFDSSNNIHPPTFVLTTRKGKKLGSIPAKNITLKKCLNTYSEVSFKVYKYNDDVLYKQWDNLKDFKLMWCREWDMWFEIYVEIDETDDIVKNVIAKSLGEAELSQTKLYNIEINTEDDIAREDYDEPTVLYNRLNPKASLLNRITEKIPHYTLVHVDESISSIQRIFSFDNITIYDAFQEIAKEIGCIFIINCRTGSGNQMVREIEVYDLSSYCFNCETRGDFLDTCSNCGSSDISRGYGTDTSIFVSTENLADNIVYSANTNSVKNCFKLVAGDDLMTATIMNCNPNGSGYLWCITEDVREDMSEELRAKLKQYDKDFNDYQKTHTFELNSTVVSNYNKLISQYNSYNKNDVNIPDNLTQINLRVEGYLNLMTSYYNTIDFDLFLNSLLMPKVELYDTSAEDQARNLSSLSSVAVMNYDSVTPTTADSAILSMAKSLIDPRYQIKIILSNFTKPNWTGSFEITSYSNESDTFILENKRVTIEGNYENFVKQKLEKTLSNSSDEIVDIVQLFNSSTFKDELKKYCLSRLVSFHDACQNCLDILIEQGISSDPQSNLYSKIYSPYYNKLGLLSEEIKLRESEIKTVFELQKNIEEEQINTQNSLDFESYLGINLWLEFAAYRREDTYQNNNYISDGLNNAELFDMALQFIEKAQEDIFKSATVQHSISAKLKNLLVMKEFRPIVDNFEVGNWLRLRADGEVYRLRLIDYKINFDDLNNIEITFSDVMISTDGMSDVESVLNQASSMATSYGAVSHQASKGNQGNKKLEDWIRKGLALTNMKIVNSADNQNLTYDAHGLLCREYLSDIDDYDDKQLKIINKGLYVTDNNWKTSKAGIGNFMFYNPKNNFKQEEAYGVIADTLVGNLILSESVGIYNTENSITLDENGLTITADATSNSNDTLFTIQKKNSDGSIEPLMKLDEKGILNISESVVIGGSEGINEATQKAIDELNKNISDLDGWVDIANGNSTNAMRILNDICESTEEGNTYIDGGMIATDTLITNLIGGMSGYFDFKNGEAYWKGKFETIHNNNYKIIIDGYSINLFNSSEENSAAISFCSSPSTFYSNSSNANLALAGDQAVILGVRPNGSWTAVCQLQKYDSQYSFEPLLENVSLGSTEHCWSQLRVKDINCFDEINMDGVVKISTDKVQVLKEASNDTGSRVELNNDDSNGCSIWFKNGNKYGSMLLNNNGVMKFNVDAEAPSFNPTSSEKFKSNICKYTSSALDAINNSIIYSYNHIEQEPETINYGLVIERECPKEIVSKNKDSINLYSMTSLAWKAIQELSKRVTTLEEILNDKEN